MSQKKTLQHTVPQLILRQFVIREESPIWVFDKHEERSYPNSIRNIASEKGFYDISINGKTASVDPALTCLEGTTAPILRKIVESKSLVTVTQQEKVTLSVFLAVQFVRTKEHRLKFNWLSKELKKKLRERGATEEQLQEMAPDDEKGARVSSIKSVLGAGDFVPYFLDKTWIIFEAPTHCPLYTSDNPVTMHNEQQFGPYGNLGLAVRGIELYFPISSRYCLGLLCHTIGEEFRKAYYNMHVLENYKPGSWRIGMKDPLVAKRFCEGVVFGTCVPLDEENVTFLNSLQVTYSSRFVYCAKDDFALVLRMIKDNPKYKEGHKGKID